MRHTSSVTVRRLTDSSAADWFAPRLLGHDHWATAGSVLPTGYEAVVRVLHPVGESGRWSDRARRTGHSMHPLVQWNCISGSTDGSQYEPDAPDEGSVPGPTLRAILANCPSHGDLLCAVWDGFGAWDERPADAAMLHIPGRDYYLFAASDATTTVWPGMDPIWRQSANVIWPADCSWIIAAEIDWGFTLVAASRTVADSLLTDDRLEAFEVDYRDDLSWFGDTINPLPAWLERQRSDGGPG